MPNLIFSSDQGAYIKVNGVCYQYKGKTSESATDPVPSPVTLHTSCDCTGLITMRSATIGVVWEGSGDYQNKTPSTSPSYTDANVDSNNICLKHDWRYAYTQIQSGWTSGGGSYSFKFSGYDSYNYPYLYNPYFTPTPVEQNPNPNPYPSTNEAIFNANGAGYYRIWGRRYFDGSGATYNVSQTIIYPDSISYIDQAWINNNLGWKNPGWAITTYYAILSYVSATCPINYP